jgi:polar amino acid transport system substrate-binding protein
MQLAGFGRLSTLVERLEGGLLDAAIVDAPLAAWLVRHRPALAEAGRPLLATPLVGLVRLQDASLRARLDEGITRLVADGRLRAILARWNLWNELQRQVLSPPRLFGGRVPTGDFSSS